MQFLGKNRETVRKHRHIKHVTNKKERIIQCRIQTIMLHTGSIEMKKTQLYMNKAVNLGFSILKLSKKINV